MLKMKKWLGELSTGVLGNILTPLILSIVGFIVAGIYIFYADNPQVVLLTLLTILVLINTVISMFLYRQQKSTLKLIQELSPLKERATPMDEASDPLRRQVDDKFEITDKYFDETSDPQKIIIKFTNRGHNIIYVNKVKYSDSGLGLPESALLSSYRKVEKGRYIIPFDQSKAEVAPGQDFHVELCLSQKWSREDINRLSGNWGYLRIDVTYNGESVEIFNSI